jgi:hypothetical protein
MINFNKKIAKPKVSFKSCLQTYLFHGTDKLWHSFSIANSSQTNHEGLSDSSIKENAIKRAFN